MKISVVVPVYNVNAFLDECVESVLKQTYSNLELILVDDGSTDGSENICDKYKMRYAERVKVVHIENVGTLRARLIGIKESTGDVVVFLDADDCLHDEALSRISNCFIKNQCDMVLYNTAECTEFDTISLYNKITGEYVFEGRSKIDLYKKLIRGEIPNCVWSKAIRSECINIPEAYFEHRLLYGEDLLMSASFLTSCSKIVYLNEGLYYYRNRSGSAVRTFNPSRNDMIKFIHSEIKNYIDMWNISEITPIFNARKVTSWIRNLFLLLNAKNKLGNSEFRLQIREMSEDPYFRDAYVSMDKSRVSTFYRLIALLLYNRQYFLICVVCGGAKCVKKIIHRR